MDPTSRMFIRANSIVEPEKKSEEKNSIKNNNQLKKFRADAVLQTKQQNGSESVKNIKSEIANQYKESPIGKVRPPPPKSPPPPSPSEAGVGKPPHPDTALLDNLPDYAGKQAPLSTPASGTPVDAKTNKQPAFLVDLNTYPANTPSKSNTDYGKIPVRHSDAKEIEQKANKLEFLSKENDFLTTLVTLAPEAFILMDKYGITSTEGAAIVAYTNEEYHGPINHQFRSLKLEKVDISDAKALMAGGVVNVELAELIAALVRALRKLPPAQLSESDFMALGRSVTMNKNELVRYVEGAEIVEPTFLSTTVSSTSMTSSGVGFWDNKENAMFFSQRVNGNARDIGIFSEYPDEKEILFLPYTKFRVVFASELSPTFAGATQEEIAADIEKHIDPDEEKEPVRAAAADKAHEAFLAEQAKQLKQEKSFLTQPSNIFSQKPVNKVEPDNKVESVKGRLTKKFIFLQEIPFEANQMPNS